MERKKEPQGQVKTRRLSASIAQDIAATAVAIQQGELAVFPTDTVYGVGANAFDGQAVQRLYVVKDRPADKGIPILLADRSDLVKVAATVPPLAQTLIDRFWPGPLTLIVPKHPDLPAAISDNAGVAVRIPDHIVARALIRQAGGAVAASSANRSGQAPAQTPDQALTDLDGRVAIILDGGPTEMSMASTVIDCTEATPRILRSGPITAADINLIQPEDT